MKPKLPILAVAAAAVTATLCGAGTAGAAGSPAPLTPQAQVRIDPPRVRLNPPPRLRRFNLYQYLQGEWRGNVPGTGIVLARFTGRGQVSWMLTARGIRYVGTYRAGPFRGGYMLSMTFTHVCSAQRCVRLSHPASMNAAFAIRNRTYMQMLGAWFRRDG